MLSTARMLSSMAWRIALHSVGRAHVRGDAHSGVGLSPLVPDLLPLSGKQLSASTLPPWVDVRCDAARTIRFARSSAPQIQNYHQDLRPASPKRRS
jgi:hypothetical protein